MFPVAAVNSQKEGGHFLIALIFIFLFSELSVIKFRVCDNVHSIKEVLWQLALTYMRNLTAKLALSFGDLVRSRITEV